MRWLLTLAAVAALVLFSNLPFVRIAFVLLGLEPIIHSYAYISGDGHFQELEVPEKGRSLAMVESAFHGYREQVGQAGLVLHRSFRFPWWRFWKWLEYASHPRWKYPYRASAATAAP